MGIACNHSRPQQADAPWLVVLIEGWAVYNRQGTDIIPAFIDSQAPGFYWLCPPTRCCGKIREKSSELWVLPLLIWFAWWARRCPSSGFAPSASSSPRSWSSTGPEPRRRCWALQAWASSSAATSTGPPPRRTGSSSAHPGPSPDPPGPGYRTRLLSSDQAPKKWNG